MSKLSISGGIKYNVLNFNNDVYVNFDSNPILSGLTEPISFYLYLDTNNYIDYACVLYSSQLTDDDNKNQLIIFLKDNYLYVQCGATTPGHQKIDISSHTSKSILVQIKRTDNLSGAADIDYIKINGISQTLTHSEITFGIFEQSLKIGTIYNPNLPDHVFKLYGATVWDLDIPGRNHWKGYVGNINSGWVDQIGSNNGNVIGTTKTTRKVTEVSTRKMKLNSNISNHKLILG